MEQENGNHDGNQSVEQEEQRVGPQPRRVRLIGMQVELLVRLFGQENMVRFEGLPEDCQVRGVFIEQSTNQICMVVEHPSFDEVAPEVQPPVHPMIAHVIPRKERHIISLAEHARSPVGPLVGRKV